VAEKRQRSKQRQAERRAQRLAGRGDGTLSRHEQDTLTPREREEVERERDPEREELEENVDLQVGAPPQDLGFSEFTTRHEEPAAPDFEIDDEELEDEAVSAPATGGPRGVRGGREADHPGRERHERGRLLEFLRAVVAELKRVQWPDRRQLTQLTGVVLFFVLIVGVYLGALDAVFSKLIQAIL
jgi:preprotein translocase subunit SecE